MAVESSSCAAGANRKDQRGLCTAAYGGPWRDDVNFMKVFIFPPWFMNARTAWPGTSSTFREFFRHRQPTDGKQACTDAFGDNEMALCAGVPTVSAHERIVHIDC